MPGGSAHSETKAALAMYVWPLALEFFIRARLEKEEKLILPSSPFLPPLPPCCPPSLLPALQLSSGGALATDLPFPLRPRLLFFFFSLSSLYDRRCCSSTTSLNYYPAKGSSSSAIPTRFSFLARTVHEALSLCLNRLCVWLFNSSSSSSFSNE